MQWLIDIIKEWIIAQAYATEAWVLEWVTPLHVSGTLDPDATCLYFKGGTYNGKTYYIRQDGMWFIWWTGVDRWYITRVLGDFSPPGWFLTSENVIGVYFNIPPALGHATVTSGYGCPRLCFVNRGDPPVRDYYTVDFVADNAWHDLDLSAIVPAGARSVTMTVEIANTAVAKSIQFRTKGNVNLFNVSTVVTQGGFIKIIPDVNVPLDANRKIQYMLIAGGWLNIRLTVKGWWL